MIEANRIKNIPTSIFSTMSKLAVENHAVNLGQGFPDFSGPDWIMEEAFKAMKADKNQYAPINGIQHLRVTLSKVYKRYYDIKWDADSEIIVTTGATEALYSAISALINPGDEVIMFEPFYDAYQSDVILAGGIPKYVTLHLPDFRFLEFELTKEITSKTKMLILNNPNNPTGKCYSREELELISKIALKHDLIILSDEVYEFLVFDNYKHIPIATLPGMKNRTITISSAGKTFGMTGWKIGFVYANAEYINAIQKVRQWTTFTVNTPGQHAMAIAFEGIDDYLPGFRSNYQAKRDLIFNLLKETNFTPLLPRGSYFIMVVIPKNCNSGNDVELAKELVTQYGIATIPPSVFYANSKEGNKMLRLCFAKKDSTIIEGINRLKQYN